MNWKIELVRKAWDIATKYHDGQKYGGTKEGEQIEYLNHIGSVVIEVMNAIQYEVEIDKELTIICAILHDTIEDTSYSINDLEIDFSENIKNGVLALTKDENLPSKKEMMIDSLDRILDQSKEIAIVKLCDRTCNLSGPPYYWNNDKKKLYIEESRMILRKLGKKSEYMTYRLQKAIEKYENSFIS